MITNREEVIDKAFKVFVKMNYERASIITLARACGLTKTGIVYYFPHKLDLFVAVVDKYVLQLHDPTNKFATPADTLAGFIEQYVAGVSRTMHRLITLLDDGNDPYHCCPNFYYIHFLSQVRMYYPDSMRKIEAIYRQEYALWTDVIRRAKESGEIKGDTNVQKAASLFRQVFFGLSSEQAFLNGLDVNELAENFHYIYSLLKV